MRASTKLPTGQETPYGKDGVITVEESKTMKTNLSVKEGMQFDRGYISPYLVTDTDKIGGCAIHAQS